MKTEQLMRPMDAARELKVNPQRLYGAIRRGTLRTYPFGGAKLVDINDVRAYLHNYGWRTPYREGDKSA